MPPATGKGLCRIQDALIPVKEGLDQKDGVFDVEIRLAVVRNVIVLVERQPNRMRDEKRVREGNEKHPSRVRFL